MFEDLKPHIEELRKRLLISVIFLIITFLICFNFWKPILEFIMQPLLDILPKVGAGMIFTQLAEPFFTAMKVSFFAGFILAMPVIFWQLWLFVAPGLYANEKKYVIPFAASASFMFLVGAAFCYYFVLPTAFRFLVNFGSQLFTAMPKISEYVGFFSKLIIAFGLSFELPVITFFLAKLGLVTDTSLKKFFRYAIVIIFIFAAIMTPPDIMSQFMLAGPLVCLYIISIIIAKIVNPASKIKDEDDEEDTETNE